METALRLLGSYWWVLAIVLVLAFYKLILRLFGVIIIAEDSI